MANPPAPTTFTPSAVTKGTVLHYGVDDLSITGILIDSYKRSAKYNKVEEVVGQDGITEGIRMSDYRADVSVSGRIIENGSFAIKVGDVLTINGDNILIMSLDLSASGTGFATYDIAGTAYEGVTGLEPA
jgi:hypothetical protein